MSIQVLVKQIEQRLSGMGINTELALGEVTIQVPRDKLIDVCTRLRDDTELGFEQLIDLCGVDYSEYGDGTWQGDRFAVVYHLLSISNNHRIRVRTFLDDEFPLLTSVIDVWAAANWFEREAFDLYGIIFEGHPDLRRILTDYGFVGHPFRKDFPLSGNVEMRYDEEKKRVIYEPVSIEPRINVPRIIRDDHRYEKVESGE
ncbi:MAG: NADH-quinone oxidoreductase subunit C [Gammaproteobacteria bacterium]|nr:NADH-quinone oxidoreductase subunit C [Gammaproteobacteria bacterium]